MFDTRVQVGRRRSEEGERPFWISYADLMTSLMVLFLVVMLTALIAFTRTVTELDSNQAKLKAEVARSKDAEAQAKKLAAENTDLAQRYQALRASQRDFEARKQEVLSALRRALPAGARLTGDSIDFGKAAQFDISKSTLNPGQEQLLRSTVPVLVRVADGVGAGVLRRVVVEGFASLDGTYLLNLDLSLARSERMMCAILDPKPRSGAALSGSVQTRARQLFLIGGYSSNSLLRTPEESRRIQLRVEWWDPTLPAAGRRGAAIPAGIVSGQCALSG